MFKNTKISSKNFDAFLNKIENYDTLLDKSLFFLKSENILFQDSGLLKTAGTSHFSNKHSIKIDEAEMQTFCYNSDSKVMNECRNYYGKNRGVFDCERKGEKESLTSTPNCFVFSFQPKEVLNPTNQQNHPKSTYKINTSTQNNAQKLLGQFIQNTSNDVRTSTSALEKSSGQSLSHSQFPQVLSPPKTPYSTKSDCSKVSQKISGREDAESAVEDRDPLEIFKIKKMMEQEEDDEKEDIYGDSRIKYSTITDNKKDESRTGSKEKSFLTSEDCVKRFNKKYENIKILKGNNYLPDRNCSVSIHKNIFNTNILLLTPKSKRENTEKKKQNLKKSLSGYNLREMKEDNFNNPINSTEEVPDLTLHIKNNKTAPENKSFLYVRPIIANNLRQSRTTDNKNDIKINDLKLEIENLKKEIFGSFKNEENDAKFEGGRHRKNSGENCDRNNDVIYNANTFYDDFEGKNSDFDGKDESLSGCCVHESGEGVVLPVNNIKKNKIRDRNMQYFKG